MNIVDVFYCLPNFLEIKASSITFIPVKTFHTKCETSRKRRVFGHKRNNFNEDDSTIFSYFVKLSSAAFFIASAFAFTDFWKRLIDSVADAFESTITHQWEMQVTRSIDFFGILVLLIGFNIATFLLWQVPNLHHKMLKYATVTRKAGLTQMVFAAFSHSSFLHCFINMYVLTSFVRAWEQYLTLHRHRIPQDLMSPDKLLAFYLSAGVVASAGSSIVQVIGKYSYHSLGASGAVFGLIGYVCSKIPDGKLSVAFFPQISFSARNGVIGLAAFDVAGLLLGAVSRWKYMIFDHAAHLSGLFFGLWYASYGEVLLYRWSDFCRRKINEIFEKR